MRSKLRTLWRGLVGLHQEEEGMEAIQVVMLVAIAAIVLIFLKTVIWPRIQNWVSEKTGELVE